MRAGACHGALAKEMEVQGTIPTPDFAMAAVRNGYAWDKLSVPGQVVQPAATRYRRRLAGRRGELRLPAEGRSAHLHRCPPAASGSSTGELRNFSS
jgi:hypothetical protein